jgi:alcohol dehydrogenase class IV
MLTEIHQFKLPETIIFGWGAAERVGEEARRFGAKALLVTGGTATKTSGLQARIAKLLTDAGLQVTIFDAVHPEPSSAVVEAAVDKIRTTGCDVVVGVGGGSPLDVAKAAAGTALLEGRFLDYLRGKSIDRAGLPFIAVPTTAGTAAEITKNAVFLDAERQVKIGARADFWFPNVALVDPELTMTMPAALTAACGMDALSHAMESYVSLRAHPASEALSAESMRLVAKSLRRAFADGSDRQAREDMALASMIAGMAFANVGCGVAHALAHVVGPAFGLSHGASCGLLLPYVLEYNLPACPEKGREIAAILTGKPEAETDGQEAVAELFRMLDDLHLPANLSGLPSQSVDLPALLPGAMLSGGLKTNPRPAGERELLDILQEAYCAIEG